VFIALRDLRFAKGRFLLMGAVVAMVALLVVMLTGLANGLANDNISGIRDLPAAGISFSANTPTNYSRSTVSLEQVAKAGAWPGVSAAAPLGNTLFNGRTSQGTSIDLSMFGVEPGSFVTPAPLTGQPLGSVPNGVLVSKALIDKGVKVGDTITLDRVHTQLLVIGTIGQESFGHIPVVYAPLRLWQEATYGPPGGAPAGQTLPGTVFEEVSVVALQSMPNDKAAMDKALGLTTLTLTDSFNASPGYKEETGTLVLIEFFLYAISAMLVAAFFSVWTIQRRSEIGLLKALGASTWYLVRDALGQAVLVLVAATAVGVGIGVALGALISGSGRAVPFALAAAPVASAAVLVIVLGLLGAAFTIRRITSVDPLIALGDAR
jgi:putative ABC transport system permease protein